MIYFLDSKYVVFKYIRLGDNFYPLIDIDSIDSVNFNDTMIEIKLRNGTYVRYNGVYMIEYEWKNNPKGAQEMVMTNLHKDILLSYIEDIEWELVKEGNIVKALEILDVLKIYIKEG